ncbi:MAG: rod shape-determining protein MreD [Prevotella sp.]|nr:rod shape-determining protein MreD [Prevotella sp.]
MNGNVLRTTLGLVLLVVVQVMFLNRIHLFGVATPLLLVYAVIVLPLDTPRPAALLFGFVPGIISDVFTNTPGVAAITLTALAFIQPAVLRLFVPRDVADNFAPSIKSMGAAKYIVYSLILTLLNCVLLFAIEDLDLHHWQHLLLDITGSTLLSYLFIITFESVRKE